jgi:L-asparaginase / beta-aspartyl-peptidase
MASSRPAVAVHGGAGTFREETREAAVEGVRRAADMAWRVLQEGGSALEAVEIATRLMESHPLYDSGIGSHLNRDGDIEVDAIIMDGARLDFGAVAAVPRVRHPVTLARLVLTESPHSMLAGNGAEHWARQHNLVVPTLDLVTPDELEAWRRLRGMAGQGAPAVWGRAGGGDTVGAVAVDSAGHVAAATSTGGTRGKWPGRVGDSPLVGCGAYADDAAGAVSSTGHGESIMRVCLAHAVCARLGAGSDAQAAAEAGMALLSERTGGLGGLIVVDCDGGVGWSYNTADMPYAWRGADGGGDGI